MITSDSLELLKLYRWFTDRILPFGGGLYEQPNLFLEATEIISRRWEFIKRERAENGDETAAHEN